MKTTVDVLMGNEEKIINNLAPPHPGNKIVQQNGAAHQLVAVQIMDDDIAIESTPPASASEKNGAQQPLESNKSELQLVLERMKQSSFGQKRNYSSIDISAEKWLMAYDAESLAKLENPPSLADGISRELERDIRYLGCELIQEGAILLKLNQTAAATGQILFQRFYYQKSFVRYNFEHMVMACLLLASKIEEEPRKPRDVLNVYHRLKQLHQRRRAHRADGSNGQKQLHRKFEYLELGGRQYVHMKNAVIKAERRLLNTLGFVVHVHHPHKLIYIYLYILGLLRKADDSNASQDQIEKSRQLLQRAWSYMNDGLRTDMFLRYTPETIACACIQLAVKTVDQPVVLPRDPFPWFELFDASDRDVRAISQMVLDLYARTKTPSLDWILAHLEKQQQKLTDEEKAKQNRELAVMKEAIIQRKSETAAVKATGAGGAVDEAGSRVVASKVEVLAAEKRSSTVCIAGGGGGVDRSGGKERERASPKKERREEKRRRSSRSRERRSDKGKMPAKRSRSREERSRRRSQSPEAKKDKHSAGARRK